MKKILTFFIILGIFIGFVVGLNSKKTQKEDGKINNLVIEQNIINELNLSLAQIDTLNPLETKNSHVAYFLNLIYEPLFLYNHENQIDQALAISAQATDEKTWLIKLREGVKWHDNTNFTSQDVKYTIDLLSSGTVNSVYVANITNISAVDIIDDYTIVISLTEKEPYFISKLTFPIVPKHCFENGIFLNNQKEEYLVGTGAYRYDSSDESKITIVAADTWWNNDAVTLKKIVAKKYSTYGESIKAFKSLEIDLILTNMYDWKEKFGFIGINSYKFESSEYELIIPNTSNPILGERTVRKAIARAINRENIISSIYQENAIIQDMPLVDSSKYKNKNAEYDLENAKQILVNAGWIQNKNEWVKDNQKLNFTLIVPKDDEVKIKVAEKIKEDLKEISINITIKELSWENFQKAIYDDKYELALASIDIKNEFQMQDLVETGNENNWANYTNIEMDNLIEKLKTSAEGTYDENMKVFKELYNNDLPYIGLYFKASNILTNKSVKGEYQATYTNPYRNIINFYK